MKWLVFSVFFAVVLFVAQAQQFLPDSFVDVSFFSYLYHIYDEVEIEQSSTMILKLLQIILHQNLNKKRSECTRKNKSPQTCLPESRLKFWTFDLRVSQGKILTIIGTMAWGTE